MAENTWKQRSNFKRDMILVETHHVRYISLGSSSDVNKLNQVCTSVWYWKTICTYMYVQMDIKYIHAYINQQLGLTLAGRCVEKLAKLVKAHSTSIPLPWPTYWSEHLSQQHGETWRNMDIEWRLFPPQKKYHDNGQSTIVKDAFPIEKWGIFQCHLGVQGHTMSPQKGPFKKESSLKTTTFSGDMFGFQFSMGVFFQMKTIEHENCEQKSAVGPSANWGLVKTCLHMG